MHGFQKGAENKQGSPNIIHYAKTNHENYWYLKKIRKIKQEKFYIIYEVLIPWSCLLWCKKTLWKDII